MPTFKIVTELQPSGVEDTKIYLDDKLIFEVDKTKYYGIKRNNMPDICKALSSHLGRDITPRDVSTARMTGYIE